VAKWQGVVNINSCLGKLDASVMAFGVDGGPNANCPLTFVNDGNWHHVVGVADAAGGRLRIYVDGVERGNSPYSGTSQTGTSPVNIGRSPDIPLQRWTGGIDEVRVENVARGADCSAPRTSRCATPSPPSARPLASSDARPFRSPMAEARSP
jgi:hypothetical protein